jgi:putative ABC transport system substrate-binding protein
VARTIIERRARLGAALLLGLIAADLAVAPVGLGQSPDRTSRVGLLMPGPCARRDPEIGAFLKALAERGYTEGRHFSLVGCDAQRRADRPADAVAELLRQRADVIVATSWQSITAAQRATTTVPIVMATVADPVALGFVENLGRPGGNITGVASPLPELLRRQLELLKEAVPRVSRVTVLINPANPAHSRWRDLISVALEMGLGLQVAGARGPSDLDSAFEAVRDQGADALLVLEDPLFFVHRARVAGLAAQNRLATMYTSREHVDAGGLIAYGPGLSELMRRATFHVDRILRGARAGDLAVEQPSRFELVISLKTAKALGLSIPRDVLARANQVIE